MSKNCHKKNAHLPRQMHKMWHIVVQIRKSNTIFSPNWLSYNDFVDIIKLIPVLIPEKKN